MENCLNGGINKMKRKNEKISYVMCILMSLSFLCVSFSTVLQQPILADENDEFIIDNENIPVSTLGYLPSIEVEKLVWNGASWEEYASVNDGDTVLFSVSIFNPFDDYQIEFSGVVFDQLPCHLKYVEESISIFGEILSEEIDWGSNTVYWYKPDPIDPHQYKNFTYQAIANCECELTIGSNNVTVSPTMLVHISGCGNIFNNQHPDWNTHPEWWSSENASLNVSDDATVEVICDSPEISIEKSVKNGVCWADVTTVYEGDDVEFRLLVQNTGFVNLTSVQVIDTLPSILSYNNDANITPTSVNGNQITWEISTLDINETVEITFTAHSEGVGEVDNICIVGSCQGAEDSDDAHIIVSGMIVEKKVWSQQHHVWLDEVDASVGDIIRFKITVYYIGNGTYNLYNIRIRDELPECLNYEDNAVPVESGISMDGKTIWWNLTINVEAGEHTSVEFNALITETSGCGPCINLANVSAQECSGHFFSKEDTAIVNAECPLCSDAGGPYSGEINEQIFIEGYAIGGSPPYTYYWDLDDDGYYDDYTGKYFYYSWDSDGTYIIGLKIKDAGLRTDVDSTSVTIYPPDNEAPDKPSRPHGETNGLIDEVYTYTTSTSDSDDDLIKYGWDWNGDDIIDEWTGFYESGVTISQSHSWDSSGIYYIKVKAEDEHGEKSQFSLSLTVIITDDSAPLKPSLSGQTSGKTGISYSYSSSTTDPEGDNIYYYFDWGDGTNSGWVGPFISGQSITESHTWNNEGSYSTKVKAKDDTGLESVWSDPLTVSMPKTRADPYDSVYWLLGKLFDRFPFLELFLQIFHY